MAADKNEEAASAPINEPERKVTNEDNFVLEEEDKEDDIALLSDLIRNEFGVDASLTLRQQQNQAKTNTFISRQLTSLTFVHTAKEFDLDQSDVHGSTVIPQKTIPEASRKPYLEFTLKDCSILSKKVKSTVEPGSALNNENDKHDDQKAVHNGERESGLP